MFGSLDGAAAVENPILELRFAFSEASGTTTASDVTLGGTRTVLQILDPAGTPADYHGAPGSGVRGPHIGSKALDFSSTERRGGRGPVAAVTNASLGFGEVTAFTATVWFKRNSLGMGPFWPRVFLLGTPEARETGMTNSIGLKFQTASRLDFQFNLVTAQASFPFDLPAQRWLFAAMVYDATNFMVYLGTEELRATLISSTTTAGQIVHFGTNGALHLGNGPLRFRPIEGWLADFRFYTSAADAEFVETIRQAAAGSAGFTSAPRLAGLEPRFDPGMLTVPQGTWVVATAPLFRDPLAPLIEYRRSQGFRVLVIDTTDVLSPEEIWFSRGARLQTRIGQSLQAGKWPNFVLLAGTPGTSDPAEARRIAVPTLAGRVGVMKDLPCDYAYGQPGQESTGSCAAAVGRFPARTVEEMRAMVQKTLALERDCRPGGWRSRLVLLEGNAGAGAMGDMFSEQMFSQRIERLPAVWNLQAVFHNPISPYYCTAARLHDAALGTLRAGELFSIYLGHSGAAGLWSVNTNFLSREDWGKLSLVPSQGVFFSCGCFGCQLTGSDGEGYGLAAMRNPAGPAAIIGATGESYAAAGLLAVDGLLRYFGQAPARARLGDYWRSVQAGLAGGPIDDLTFTLLDQSDGSGGKVPLAIQRLEDLEMWLLFGDPAMRLPVIPADVAIKAPGPVHAGVSLGVSGMLPARLAGAGVRVTIERPAASRPADLEKLPADTPENREARERVAAENYRRANQFVLASSTAAAEGLRFKCALAVPDKLPWPKLVVRAYAEGGSECGQGVAELKVIDAR